MPNLFKALDSVIPTEVRIGQIIAALMLVPAAVVLSLYPINGVLGVVSFYTASLPLGSFRLLLITPVLWGLYIALTRARRDWQLVAMLLPGIILVLLGPEHIGAYQPRADASAYRPDTYAPAEIATRISNIEHSANAPIWKYFLPSSISSLDRARALQDTAEKSVAAWKERGTIDNQKSEIQQRIAQATARRNALGPRLGGFAGALWDQQAAPINGEIATLNAQLNKLNAVGPAGDIYPAAVSALASLKVELDARERLIDEQLSFIKSVPYVVAASVSFLVFMYSAGFMNVAMLVLVLGTALTCLWSEWPITLDDWPTEVSLILYPAFICLVSAFVMRFLFRGYLDNVHLTDAFNKFDRKHLQSSLARAFLFWLPFPIVIVGAALFNNLVYSYASQAIYCEGSAKQLCGSLVSEAPILDSDPSRDTLRDDINAAIYRLFAQFEAEAIRSAEGARSGVAGQVNATKSQILATFDRILPGNVYEIFPDLRPPDSCRWFLPDIKCFAKKIALERLNSAYQAPRNRFRARVSQTLDDIGNKIIAGVVTAATGFQTAIKGEFERGVHYATKSVDVTFVLLNVFSVTQMGLMLLVSIRAFLLIFGRMVYQVRLPADQSSVDNNRQRRAAKLPSLAMTHLEDRILSSELAEVEAYDDAFELSSKDAGHLPVLTKRSQNVAAADQATTLLGSRYAKWPFRRIANGCLVLTRVTRPENRKSIRFSTIGGRQLIVWRIPAGKEVFFRWDRFVAATESMQIKKTVSLRVGGLTTGSTMHASVVGPGMLIQESLGLVVRTQQEKDPDAVFPSRLMSWQSGTKVRIESSRGLTSAYVDPPSIGVSPGAIAVYDTGGGWPRGLGLLRELIRLLRP